MVNKLLNQVVNIKTDRFHYKGGKRKFFLGNTQVRYQTQAWKIRKIPRKSFKKSRNYPSKTEDKLYANF